MGLVLAVLLGILLCGCNAPLTVRTEKIDRKYLASYHAETPDPLRCRFFKGQLLLASWHLPHCKPPFHMKLFLVRANHTRDIIERTLTCCCGNQVFYFLGEDWCTKGEVLTWRAEIYERGILVAVHCQKPWVDWIDDSE